MHHDSLNGCWDGGQARVQRGRFGQLCDYGIVTGTVSGSIPISSVQHNPACPAATSVVLTNTQGSFIPAVQEAMLVAGACVSRKNQGADTLYFLELRRVNNTVVRKHVRLKTRQLKPKRE